MVVITPPTIVERAEQPSVALATFVAQELEHWGFEVLQRAGPVLCVKAGEKPILIRVSEWAGEEVRARVERAGEERQ